MQVNVVSCGFGVVVEVISLSTLGSKIKGKKLVEVGDGIVDVDLKVVNAIVVVVVVVVVGDGVVIAEVVRVVLVLFLLPKIRIRLSWDGILSNLDHDVGSEVASVVSSGVVSATDVV